MQRHVSDVSVHKARREGWRSRAVFKLSEIDRKKKLLRKGMVVVELGSAPGSWSQYVVERIQPDGFLIAVDCLDMEPLPGVCFIQGDCTDPAVQQAVQDQLSQYGGQYARKKSAVDLVLSDMAPNLTGVATIDQARIEVLLEDGLDFCNRHLKEGGACLMKCFQGTSFSLIHRSFRQAFSQVDIEKPDASRSRSAECYLFARGFRRLRHLASDS